MVKAPSVDRSAPAGGGDGTEAARGAVVTLDLARPGPSRGDDSGRGRSTDDPGDGAADGVGGGDSPGDDRDRGADDRTVDVAAEIEEPDRDQGSDELEDRRSTDRAVLPAAPTGDEPVSAATAPPVDAPSTTPAPTSPAVEVPAPPPSPISPPTPPSPISPAPAPNPSRSPSPNSSPIDPDLPTARGAALAWLGWAVGAVVLVLLLAWLLSTCAGGRPADERATTVIGLDRVGEPDPAGPDTGATDPRDVASATAAPTTSVEIPVATTLSVGRSPDQEVEIDVEVDLEAAAAAVVAGTGVEATVIDRTVVLEGTVTDPALASDLEAGIAALIGVEAIENRIRLDDPATGSGDASGSADAGSGDASGSADAGSGDASGSADAGSGDASGSADAGSGDASEASGGLAVGSTLNRALGLAPVTFATASAELTDEGRAVVDQVATHLRDRPELRLTIDGHTDDDGNEEANLALSQERADAVVAWLTTSGIAADRLVAVGHGEARPLVANDSLDNKAINRRIEFTVGHP